MAKRERIIYKSSLTDIEKNTIINMCNRVDYILTQIQYRISSITKYQEDIKYSSKNEEKYREYCEYGIVKDKEKVRELFEMLKRICIDLRAFIRYKEIQECKDLYAVTRLLDERKININCTKAYRYTSYLNAVKEFDKKYQALKEYMLRSGG